MAGGLTIAVGHFAHSNGAAHVDLVILLAACAALTVLVLAVWAPPMLAGARAGSGRVAGSVRWRSASSYPHDSRPRRSRPSWSAPFVAGAAVAATALVVYLTLVVPVQIPAVEGPSAHRYWPAALFAGVLVVMVDGAFIALAMRGAPRSPAHETAEASATSPRVGFQFVPAPAICVTAIASVAALTVALAVGLPLWLVAFAGGLPWSPALCVEAVRKYRRHGLYVFLLVLALLQVGHVGEHAAQITQLLLTDGDLARSHGVFGQLDFETVHFFWDTGVWLSTGLLLARFGGGRWLWLSFAAASMHEIEHVYLYWLFIFHRDFYMQGGLAGILGRGGVMGSPLYRPYLHFLYNLAVVVPMLVALVEHSAQSSEHGRATKR